ncbi:Hint domain-containing protein [Szabonella alba]|uniref:Hint domain-containing protein n=1 Tax=Szabonella alba TaxID=2804194 RepID=A0A8K0XYJ2_9RHOB|nr:Hint domain-containing protein [Szabonella alba]MBL4915796.1 Hint domain-containing protein [Szabonella alba]
MAADRTGAVLAAGSFVLEFEAPPGPGTVLLDYQAQGGWPRAFSIFADPQAGVAVMHRQGARLARHLLPGPLNFAEEGTAQILFAWDGPGRRWQLALDLPGQRRRIVQQGADPMPLPLADIAALCRDGAVRHRRLRWLGIRQGSALPLGAAWIGPATPIDTPQGPQRADRLRIGDAVLTASGGERQIRALHRIDLPGRGAPAPVRLRAPYFARPGDILVSPDQPVLISGAEVEYLFGVEQVLAEAADLAEGRAALREPARTATGGLALDLGRPDLLLSGGCALLSAQGGADAGAFSAPCRVLHGFEVPPLLDLLGRKGSRSAA